MAYQIEQKTAYQWEVIENGEFATYEQAVAAMCELETVCGYTGLRVVEA